MNEYSAISELEQTQSSITETASTPHSLIAGLMGVGILTPYALMDAFVAVGLARPSARIYTSIFSRADTPPAHIVHRIQQIIEDRKGNGIKFEAVPLSQQREFFSGFNRAARSNTNVIKLEQPRKKRAKTVYTTLKTREISEDKAPSSNDAQDTFSRDKSSPERMEQYFREVKAMDYLTLEEEISIARRIEDARAKIITGILSSFSGLEAIQKFYKDISISQRPIFDVTSELEHKENGHKSEVGENAETLSVDVAEPASPQMTEGKKTAIIREAKSIERLSRFALKKHFEYYLSGRTLSSEDRIALEKNKSYLIARVLKVRPRDKLLDELIAPLGETGTLSNQILQTALKAGIKREDFVREYVGYETGGKWPTLLLATGRVQAETIKDFQHKLSDLHLRAGLPFADYKNVLHLIQQGNRELLQAKKEMLEAHLRLAIKHAKKHINRGLPLPDLIQEANVGLLAAVEKFDYKRGYRFSTYAVRWVKETIVNSIDRDTHILGVAVRSHAKLRLLQWKRAVLAGQHGREPTIDELSKAMSLEPEAIKELLAIPEEPRSLDAPLGNEPDGTPFGHLVKDENAVNPIDIISEIQREAKVKATLLTIPKREAEVLRLRFGIGADPLTLKEVGVHLGVSFERARQLEVRALKILRVNAERLGLTHYTDMDPTEALAKLNTEINASVSARLFKSYKKKITDKVSRPKINMGTPKRKQESVLARPLRTLSIFTDGMPAVLDAFERANIMTVPDLVASMVLQGIKERKAQLMINKLIRQGVFRGKVPRKPAILIAHTAGLSKDIAFKVEKPIYRKPALKPVPRRAKYG